MHCAMHAWEAPSYHMFCRRVHADPQCDMHAWHAAGVQLVVQSAWTGFATGIFHTLCGPDHLAVRSGLRICTTALAHRPLVSVLF